MRFVKKQKAYKKADGRTRLLFYFCVPASAVGKVPQNIFYLVLNIPTSPTKNVIPPTRNSPVYIVYS